MTISQAGLDFLTHEEGVILHPYKDSAGIPTIGIGTTIYPSGNRVTMDDPPITLQEAQDYLAYHLTERVYPALAAVTVLLNQNQVDSLCSFIYNIGSAGFISSTLLKKINLGAPCSEITEQFLRWKNAGGKPVLLARREREAHLYCS